MPDQPTTLPLSDLRARLTQALTDAIDQELARFPGEDDHSLSVREGLQRAATIQGPALARVWNTATKDLGATAARPDTADTFLRDERTRELTEFLVGVMPDVEATLWQLRARLEELIPGVLITPRWRQRATGRTPQEIKVSATDRGRTGAYLIPRRDGWLVEVWMPREQIHADGLTAARRGGRPNDTHTYARINHPVDGDLEPVCQAIAAGVRACRQRRGL